MVRFQVIWVSWGFGGLISIRDLVTGDVSRYCVAAVPLLPAWKTELLSEKSNKNKRCNNLTHNTYNVIYNKKGIKTILGNNFFIYIDNTEIFTNVSKERATVPLWLKAHANGDRSRRVVTSRTASCSSNYRRQVWARTYGIKEYLYCYLIHFCNTFDDNNRSVSWKRATQISVSNRECSITGFTISAALYARSLFGYKM